MVVVGWHHALILFFAGFKMMELLLSALRSPHERCIGQKVVVVIHTNMRRVVPNVFCCTFTQSPESKVKVIL